MYKLLLFVMITTALSCYLVKWIGKRCEATPRQRFWIGLTIPVAGILLYEWIDHHQDLIRRFFGMAPRKKES